MKSTKRIRILSLSLVACLLLAVIGFTSSLTVSAESVPVDVVFVIDTTGSMGEEITNVKNSIQTFVSILAEKGVDAHLALIDYRDTTEGESTVIHMNGSTPWFSDAGMFQNELGKLVVTGGGDRPETVIDGLEAARRLDWREDAYKFVIAVTDADYKKDNTYGVSGMDAMISLLANDKVITSVATEPTYYPEYTDLADGTTGILMNINNDFSDEMLALIGIIFDEVEEKVINKISVKSYPNKTTYVEGQYFDPAGLVITVHYSDGSTVELDTGFSCLPDTRLTLGDTVITISYRGFYETIPLTVTKAIVAVDGVVLDKNILNMHVGETATLNATVSPADATNQNVAWYSSNEAAATVAGGVVTAVAPGETEILVRTVDGNYEAVCSVVVLEEDHVHSYTAVTVEPSCGVPGYTADVCNCGNMINVVEIPALEHDAQWQYDELQHWIYCTECEQIKPESTEDHAFQWVIDRPATAEVPGIEHEECKCGAVRNENTEIPVLDPTNPATGDLSNVWLFGIIMLLSAVGLTLVITKKQTV